MTDRELLEMAAKAAGIAYDAEASKPRSENRAWFGLWRVCEQEPTEADRRYWNPLTDDGDALRLAVKLHLWEAVRDGYYHMDSDGDIDEATRRAIVRAAAAIGKAKGKKP